jgi:hypothetical protein
MAREARVRGQVVARLRGHLEELALERRAALPLLLVRRLAKVHQILRRVSAGFAVAPPVAAAVTAVTVLGGSAFVITLAHVLRRARL